MWVIKLGGSLARSARLPRWLEALAGTAAVIVPGGGPFADAVREAQAHWGFDGQTAHDMAILGMRQYGRMLLGLCPRLQAMDAQAKPGQAQVWLPLPETLADQLPATWDITSDSLAAWLAKRIGASRLLLVKSVDELGAGNTVPSLGVEAATEAGWIDPAFGHYGQGLQTWLCGVDGHTHLPQALAEPGRFFCRLRPGSPALAFPADR